MSEENKNNDSIIEPQKKQGQGKTGRGSGGGRPKGSTNKYSGKDIIARYKTLFNTDFLDDLLRDLAQARANKESKNVLAYQTILARYVFTEMDPVEAEEKVASLSYDELVKIAKLAIGAGAEDANKTE